MKKLVIALALILGLSFGTQSYGQNGGLFSKGSDATRTENNDNRYPGLPGHKLNGNQPAPVGSGLLLLMGMGAAYAASKRRKE